MIPLNRFKKIIDTIAEQKKNEITAMMHYNDVAYFFENVRNYSVTTIISVKSNHIYAKRIEKNAYDSEALKKLGVTIGGGNHARKLRYIDSKKNINFEYSVPWVAYIEDYGDTAIFKIENVMRLYKKEIADFDDDTLFGILIRFMESERKEVSQEEFLKFIDNLKRLDRGYTLTNSLLKGFKDWFEENKVAVYPNYSCD